MKLAVAAALLFSTSSLAGAEPKSASEPAPSRLRNETIGLAPAHGTLRSSSSVYLRKDDDTTIGRSLASAKPSGPASSPVSDTFKAVEVTVLKKRPKASGRLRISFGVDRRGRVIKPIAVGIDRAIEKAVESQLANARLPVQYAGQNVETILSFHRGKLLRR
jgi:hypothetical protein